MDFGLKQSCLATATTEALGWADPCFAQQMMDAVSGDAFGSGLGGFLEVFMES